MNVDLTAIMQIVSLAVLFCNVLFLLSFRRWLSNEIEDYIIRLKDFYAIEKKDIVESLPTLFNNILIPQKMSELGKMSSLSRQMKSLEQELMAEGINEMTGIPVGSLVAKYAQKYPFIMQLLPMFLNKNKANPTENEMVLR